VLALGGLRVFFLTNSLERRTSALTRGDVFIGFGAVAGSFEYAGSVSSVSIASSNDSALVCLDPLKTRLCDVFVLFNSAFRRAISSYIHAFVPSSSSSLFTFGDAAIGFI